ncbi:uncharacterized protein LOC114159538 isoform X4 [Xiphophorus couchianus]|uniref:uncharacterized protein LOC114159538 isoform X4 n=1 Tax=Xiphophorus couchianus TaxID=32473 RepID=UPI001015E7AA|nr:uncharacterized protein LOC114159538 isoform X4 [Xiphophorus couchianus]
MAFRIFGKISVLILFVRILQIYAASECKSKNITCTEIRVAEGFRYEHECPEGSEIALERNNKMNFGSADLRKQLFNFLPPVVKMDNHSVITEDCQDLNITCTLTTENLEKLAGEKCVNFKSIPAENFPPGNPSVSPGPPIQDERNLGWIAVLVILLVIFGLMSYYCWKNHKRGVIFNCLQRNQEGSGFPIVQTGDLEGQNNADVRNGEDPRGCGENDRDALQSVMRELNGGGAAAHHHTEEQPLLPDQRTAKGDFNRSYVAVTLVNELSSNLEPVTRCSATPDADVESTYSEKPTN